MRQGLIRAVDIIDIGIVCRLLMWLGAGVNNNECDSHTYKMRQHSGLK